MPNYLLYIWLLVCISFIICQESPSLYNNDETVVDITLDNYKHVLYNQNNVWIVKFYLHWCGHCITYSKLWKEFGQDVQSWNKFLKVGAVNCGDRKNDYLCNKYNLIKYPQILLFPPYSDSTTTFTEIPVKYDLQELEDYTLKQLAFISSLPVSRDWPNLLPFIGDRASKDKLLTQLSRNKSVIILQNPDNPLGIRIILDAQSKLGDSVSFIILSPQNLDPGLIAKHTQLQLLDVKSLGAGLKAFQTVGRWKRFIRPKGGASPFNTAILVRLGTAGKNYMQTQSPGYSIEEVIDRLGVGKFGQRSRTTQPHPTKFTAKEPADSNDPIDVYIKSLASIKGHYNCVFVEDLENALYTALSQEVLRHRSFDGPSTKALLYFLNVTALFYPVYDGAKINNFLYHISLYVISRRDPLTSAELRGFMEREGYSSKIFPETNRRWINCQGSSPFYRGYSCGLWTLFHTLAANSMLGSKKNGAAALNGLHVLKAIREYVNHFFGCAECSDHYLKMSASLENDLRTIADRLGKAGHDLAPSLWLWDRHNRVNQRLSNQTSTLDPAAPKIQFPPETLCRDCRLGPQWDIGTVSHFLESYYGQPNNRPYTRRDIPLPGDSVAMGRRCVKMHN